MAPSQAPHMIGQIVRTPETVHAVAKIDTAHSLASMQLGAIEVSTTCPVEVVASRALEELVGAVVGDVVGAGVRELVGAGVGWGCDQMRARF